MQIQLDSRIKKVKEVATEGFKELGKFQKNSKKLLKTGYEEIDCHIGGMLPGDVVLLAGSPSSGKSETLYRITDNVMNPDINPDASNFVSLEFSLEMKMLNKLIRSVNRITGKKKSEIILEEFSEEESIKVKEYYSTLQDDRRYLVQEPIDPKEFYTMTRDFCRLNSDKSAIFLTADHILLYKGKDKQAVLEEISEYINLLKLEFNNVYFCILSQLNRGYSAVVKEKSNDMIPNNTHLFGSSFMEQLASYIVIITNPYKQSIVEYLRFHEDRYDYLSEFFVAESKGKISFETVGNLFFFVTKIRESDNEWRNLFIRRLDLPKEQVDKMKAISKKEQSNISDFQAPIFQSSTPVFENDFVKEKSVDEIVKPVSFANISDAFDSPDLGEELPF